MLRQIRALIADEEAPTAVEYALMIALIAVVIIAGATLLGTSVNQRFSDVAGSINSGN
jgi:pilus assembly protein Flp/PilA